MDYTFQTTDSGTVQVSQNGQVITTATPQYASQQYGYNPEGGVESSPTGYQYTQDVGGITYGTVNTSQQQTTQPVTILSSSGGEKIVNENTQTLQTLEQAVAPSNLYEYYTQQGQQLPSVQERSGLYEQAGLGSAQSYEGTAQQNTALLNFLLSPAQQQMTNQINQLAESGAIPPEAQEGLTQLQSSQDDLLTATAQARGALAENDYQSMDFWIQRANESRKAYEQQLSEYFKQTAPLRQEYLKSLSPSAREQQIGQQLVDLRSQIDQFNLQTQKDQLSEFEGQTQSFAAGRAKEIDFKASFARQEMALKEQNLLMQLGLEQEARKMKGMSAEAQLSFIRDDFNLQQTIQDRIAEQEEDLYQKSRQLTSDARQRFADMLDILDGVNPDNIPVQTRFQLQQLAQQMGIPFELVAEGLKTQYQQNVYDQAITERKLGLEEGRLGLAESQLAQRIAESEEPEAPDLKILGSASTGYFSYDPATGQTTQISGPTSPDGGGDIGSDLADAYAAIEAGADPIAVRRAFLADHPKSSSAWDEYFEGADDEVTYPTIEEELDKSGLFGWGFLGL